MFSVFANGTDVNSLLTKFESYMAENYYNSHSGDMGIEFINDGKPISQANMAFELERSLPDDPGFCQYSTITDNKESLKILAESHNSKASEVMQELDELGKIAHITLRKYSEGERTLCSYAYYRIVLTNGSMIWLDFDFTSLN